MSKSIGCFLGGIEVLSDFFKEQQEEEKEFSQYGEEAPLQSKRVIHTEYDSIVKQWRGY